MAFSKKRGFNAPLNLTYVLVLLLIFAGASDSFTTWTNSIISNLSSGDPALYIIPLLSLFAFIGIGAYVTTASN